MRPGVTAPTEYKRERPRVSRFSFPWKLSREGRTVIESALTRRPRQVRLTPTGTVSQTTRWNWRTGPNPFYLVAFLLVRSNQEDFCYVHCARLPKFFESAPRGTPIFRGGGTRKQVYNKAERAGFEPAVPCGTRAFQARAALPGGEETCIFWSVWANRGMCPACGGVK